MVSKNDTDLYEKLNKALTLGKPVLWYEDENTCYYIDTISKSGTDIILTKGGKTITIENDGDITEVGDVQNHLYHYAIFIENNQTGRTFVFDINKKFENGEVDDVLSFVRNYLYAGVIGNESTSGLTNDILWSLNTITDNETYITLRCCNYDNEEDIIFNTNDEGFKITIQFIKQLF